MPIQIHKHAQMIIAAIDHVFVEHVYVVAQRRFNLGPGGNLIKAGVGLQHMQMGVLRFGII